MGSGGQEPRAAGGWAYSLDRGSFLSYLSLTGGLAPCAAVEDTPPDTAEIPRSE